MLDPQTNRVAQQAERYLRTARMALQDGDTDSAISRAYYALYHMTVVLVEQKANQRRKRWDHIELHRAFLDSFTKRGYLFNQRDANDWETARQTRLDADYETSSISGRKAIRVLDGTERLVHKML